MMLYTLASTTNNRYFFLRGAQWPSGLERCTGDRVVLGSNPAAATYFRFGTLIIPFTPLCQCLSEETLKAVGPFYLVSTPGEVKYPTQGVNV